ncbi:MAG: hypothetical protein QOD74_477 [Variibacter sp.]|nr:hypothetical protein [Variibacter sp.]
MCRGHWLRLNSRSPEPSRASFSEESPDAVCKIAPSRHRVRPAGTAHIDQGGLSSSRMDCRLARRQPFAHQPPTSLVEPRPYPLSIRLGRQSGLAEAEPAARLVTTRARARAAKKRVIVVSMSTSATRVVSL